MSPRGEVWLKEVLEREGGWLDGDGGDWQPHVLPLPENRLTGEEKAGAAETYEDGVWYRRPFELTEDDLASGCLTLKALGVSYIADLWMNGEWIGVHEGGFTPFAFDVTSCARAGTNEIRIRVDNPPWGSRNDTIPAVQGTDFFNYTGVIQELYLEATDAVHVVRADFVPTGTDGELRVHAVVRNGGSVKRHVRLRGKVFEADAESELFLSAPEAARIKGIPAVTDRPLEAGLDLDAGEVRVLGWDVKIAEPKLWSLGFPHLYVGEFTLTEETEGKEKREVDRFAAQFGLRTVSTNKTQLLLNGKPVFLAGIARHEEWPDTGRTVSWDRIRADLEHARSLHANMVRTGHYPNHVHTYILLDRLGLAAMSEIPLWQFETEHYEAQRERGLALQMWREMVFSQYNRPSVLLWSTQNESKDVALRLEHNRMLVNDLRSRYDDGRLITQSAAADQPGPSDPSMEPLDVAGWTMYFGIFHGGTPYEGTLDFLERAHRAFPDKPILNTEFGHWTGEGDAEAHKQTEIYRETLRAMLEKAIGPGRPEGCLAGIDFWILYDWYVNHNDWIDTFGLFHMDRRTPKPLFERLQTDYRRLANIEIDLI